MEVEAVESSPISPFIAKHTIDFDDINIHTLPPNGNCVFV